MTEHIVLSNGDQEWRKDGKLHRDGDKPAYIGSNGTQMWYQHGELLPNKKVLVLKRQLILKRNLSRVLTIHSLNMNRDAAGVICSFSVQHKINTAQTVPFMQRPQIVLLLKLYVIFACNALFIQNE